MSVLERRVGELRPTQLIHSFGVGAIIELPHFSAILMGLDDWPAAHCRPIVEERLLDAVQRSIGAQVDKLVAPPFEAEQHSFVAPGDAVVGAARRDVPAVPAVPLLQAPGPRGPVPREDDAEPTGQGALGALELSEGQGSERAAGTLPVCVRERPPR